MKCEPALNRSEIVLGYWLMASACVLIFGDLHATFGYQSEPSKDEDGVVEIQETLPDLSAFKPTLLTEPPPRKLLVVEQSEVLKQRPHANSTELLSKKYAAVLKIQLPSLNEDQRSRISELAQNIDPRRQSRSVYRINDTSPGFFVSDTNDRVFTERRSRLGSVARRSNNIWDIYQFSGPVIRNHKESSLKHYFEALAKDVPVAQRPSDLALEFLHLSTEAGLYSVVGLDRSTSQSEDNQFMIVLYVASPEEAENVGNALMTLLDYGLTHHIQKDVLNRWQETLNRGPVCMEELVTTQSKLEIDQAALAKHEPIPANVIESIKQRRYNLEVDFNGVTARNDAILAAIEKHSSGTIGTRLLEMQIEAQVELRELAAQRDSLQQLIDDYDSCEQLKARIDRSQKLIANLDNAIKKLPFELEEFQIASEFVRPLEVQNNEILLYPVQWGE